MRSRTAVSWAALVAAAVLLAFAFASVRKPAQARDEARRLLVSVYDNEAPAAEALRAVKAARDRGDVDVEAYELVAKNPDGKIKLRERRARGTRPAQAVTAVGGVFGVSTGMGLGASSSASIAYLRSNLIGMPDELVFTLRDVLPAGGAAVVVAVDEKRSDVASSVLAVGAARVLTHDLPATIEQAEGFKEPRVPISRPVVVPGSP
jgi:uncharacterized membrane protein